MTHMGERDDPHADDAFEESMERARLATERLKAISFLPPGERRPHKPVEWDPDPLVRARRAIERLRAIKFRNP